jgi:magnesium chelatase subunit I
MHYGLLPRANRGIFAINELPDLAGQDPGGLFNILQEGDVQIKGYPIRLPLDVLMVFSANPEDYTARGKIITPLEDRIGSEIRTHYPATRDAAMAITAQEPGSTRRRRDSGVRPRSGREVAFQARADQKIDKRSGVSQRLPISLLENVVSNAERRALLAAKPVVAADDRHLRALPAITGKFELEYEGELRGADNVAKDIIRSAVGNVFNGYFANADLRQVTEWFDLGGNLQVDDRLAADQLIAAPRDVQGLRELAMLAGIDATRRTAAAPRSTSCSKASTRRRRSAGPRSSSTSPPNRPAARARAACRPSRLGAGDSESSGARRSTTTERIRSSAGPSVESAGAYEIPLLQIPPEDLDGLDLEELLSKLSDLLLSSGFDNPYGSPYDDEEGVSAEALHDAIWRRC